MHINVTPTSFGEARCARRPSGPRSLHVHSIPWPPRPCPTPPCISIAKASNAARTPRSQSCCLPCVCALQLRVPILFSGFDRAACSSRLLKPLTSSAQAVCSSRLLIATRSRPLNQDAGATLSACLVRASCRRSHSRKLPSRYCVSCQSFVSPWGRGRGSRQVTSSWSFSIVCRHLVLRYGNSHICTLW